MNCILTPLLLLLLCVCGVCTRWVQIHRLMSSSCTPIRRWKWKLFVIILLVKSYVVELRALICNTRVEVVILIMYFGVKVLDFVLIYCC